MPKTAVMTMTVNGFGVEWSSDSKRKAKPCIGCKLPTDGREDEIDGNGTVTHGTKPICMNCSIGGAMKKAFAGARIVNGGDHA